MVETNNPWKIKKEKQVYDNPWMRVIQYEVINPSGGEGIYGKVHFKNTAIGIVALDEDDNIYLVGQYRFVLSAYSWELPEGGCPEGEDPLKAAQRELLEETGLTATHWEELFRMHLSNSITDELALIFLAKGLHQGSSAPEETEDLQVKKISFGEACRFVEDGTITDAITVAAIFKIQLLRSKNPL